MEITGCIAFVTGANRGLGKAYAQALLDAGAAKVYAGARDPAAITDPRLTPVRLDVTIETDVIAAAQRCGDVNLLINNAGALFWKSALAEGAETALRDEMDVNVFGVLRMVRAFAPVLARNGGGTIVNMLSVVSWFTSPFNATYGASKHAAEALTESARIELKSQGTHVVAVYAGFIDTDMAASIDAPKTTPQHVAEQTLIGVRNGDDLVLADDRARLVWDEARRDPAMVHARMQRLWDAAKH
jgi:NAD(P)-dependent dehydrogenase (short-subunit alcohol dehydrogenase family)